MEDASAVLNLMKQALPPLTEIIHDHYSKKAIEILKSVGQAFPQLPIQFEPRYCVFEADFDLNDDTYGRT